VNCSRRDKSFQACIKFHWISRLSEKLFQEASFLYSTVDANYVGGDLVLIASAANVGLVNFEQWGIRDEDIPI